MRKAKIISVLIIASLSIYSFWYEPRNLEVTRHDLSFGDLGKTLKIAHVSDLHTKGLGTLEKRLIDKILEESPDVILISGDIANPSGTREGYLDVLTQLKAPLGIYFVSGNWEHWTPIEDQASLLKESNITNIENKVLNIKDNIWLVGFEDELEGNPDLSILKKIPADTTKISIFHSPSFFHKVRGIQLSLSGHSHGGQVRLPLIGALWVPEGTDQFVAGWFEKEGSKMYVSRGLGNSILPMRFNCRPELALLNIKY